MALFPPPTKGNTFPRSPLIYRGGYRAHAPSISTTPLPRVVSVPSGIYYAACRAPKLGLYVAAGFNSAAGIISRDGYVWRSVTLPASAQWYSMCWADEINQLVAVTLNSATIATSVDGINWIGRSGFSVLASVAWSPRLRKLVALRTSTGSVAFSGNAIDWAAGGVVTTTTWQNIKWIDRLRLFVGLSSTGLIATSRDGENWINGVTLSGSGFRSLCWSEDRALIVAVGVNTVYTSRDAINWRQEKNIPLGSWFSVDWLPTRGMFLAAVESGGGSLMYSRDGSLWFAVSSALTNGGTVLPCVERRRFLVTSTSGNNAALV